MEEEKRVRIVIIHHPNDQRHFTFSVPEGINLYPGDIVLCDTSMGKNQVGHCITPSYTMDEAKLPELLGVTKAKLKPVKGKLVPVMFDEEYLSLLHAACASGVTYSASAPMKDKDGCF